MEPTRRPSSVILSLTRANIRTLAGYVRTRNGETLAFAIMADSFEEPGSAANEAIDRIAVRLAGFSRTAN